MSDEPNSKQWYKQLRDLRVERGYGLNQMSRLTGIPRRTLSRWEDGGIEEVNSLSYERRVKLYELTDLEVFRPADYTKGEILVTTLEVVAKRRRGRPRKDSYQTQIPLVVPLAPKGDNNLEIIAREISKLSHDVRMLRGDYIPTEQERRDIVNDSIGTLYGQMEYFVEAPQNERDALARSINFDLWASRIE